MIFPFRTSTIFRNRWVALLWAVGICFMASEIVDGVSGVTEKADQHAAVAAPTADASSDPVAVALGNTPPPRTAPSPLEDHIAR